MNEPKKLTPRQKNIISMHGHNPDDYCYIDERGQYYIFMKKNSGQKLWIEKRE